MATAVSLKVRALAEKLSMTQGQVGEVVGSSARAVARWGAGKSVPQKSSRQRLLELAYVAEELSKVMKPEEANLWIFSPNALLDHETPAQRIHDGEYRTVLNLIDALAEGIVV